MARQSTERLLLIGDSSRQMQSAIAQALPNAHVTCVNTVFDGLGELSINSYGVVLAAAEPIERRPEPAVRALREMAGKGRLILFGHPTLEILSRKMLQFGCDDYVITPSSAAELQQMFGSSPMRLSADSTISSHQHIAEPSAPPDPAVKIAELPLAQIFLEAMLQSPHDAPAAAIRAINLRIGPEWTIRYGRKNQPPVETPDGHAGWSHPVRVGNDDLGMLHLFSETAVDGSSVERALANVAVLFAKVAALQDRHNRLQKLAVTDDLTGLYNARYFRHFLGRIIERARSLRFPVTLLLFDIDDFKKYNDQYGHGAGDEILKQTAQLMKRCCREHDLVARIGGDEFAVVFWDKEGPRQPKDPKKSGGASRPPQTPVQIFERFRKLAASSDFAGLGASGKGRLSVSGGLAVFPYDASDVPGLIKAADDYLMFKAKQAGKNSVYLVEGQEPRTDK